MLVLLVLGLFDVVSHVLVPLRPDLDCPPILLGRIFFCG
jgi:hypothetical protein